MALIAIDIDDFKPINDRYGHGVGDQVLIQVVECLERCVRPDDLLARWGGDEFILVLPKGSLEDAKAVAERICQTVRDNPLRSDFNVTLSVGVAARQPGESPAALMARADQALYRAKAAGKDVVCE